MTLGEALISVWQQALGEGRDDIELEGKTYPVTVSRAKGLRMVEFNVGPHRLVGIEQNPKTGSRWAALAREGNRIMQFRCKGAYVANVCEGKLLRYPAWEALELPE
jgi:phage protein U